MSLSNSEALRQLIAVHRLPVHCIGCGKKISFKSQGLNKKLSYSYSAEITRVVGFPQPKWRDPAGSFSRCESGYYKICLSFSLRTFLLPVRLHALLCWCSLFLLLARYFPNVAKRSIWDQCKKKYWRPTDDRPKTSHLGKFQMAISPRGVVRSTSCLVLGWGFRVGGSNGANSFLTKFNRYVGENNARGVDWSQSKVFLGDTYIFQKKVFYPLPQSD